VTWQRFEELDGPQNCSLLSLVFNNIVHSYIDVVGAHRHNLIQLVGLGSDHRTTIVASDSFCTIFQPNYSNEDIPIKPKNDLSIILL